MIAKIRNIVVALGISLIAVLLLSSNATVRVEASEIDVYTSSEENTTEKKKTAVVETTVTNSDATTTATVEMIETYNEEYGLYEETIGNEFFIYANVGNGNMSSEPVVIDIPANIDYILEKDGKEITYSKGEKLKGKGNYVLRVTAVRESTTYQSTFRFSIRDAIKKKEKKSIEKDVLAAPKDEERTEYDTKAEGVLKPDVSVAIDESSSDKGQEGDGEAAKVIEKSLNDVSKYTKFHEVYDETTGEYVNTLFSGEIFRANFPNGIITNNKVILNIPDTIEYIIYKDDKPYETTSLQFSEAGSYRIAMSCKSLNYILAYGDETKVTYSFRIIGNAVSDIHIFNVPAGFTLTEVYFKNSEIFAANQMQGSYFKLSNDGSYIFNYINSSTGISYSTNVELDTKAPEASIYIKNGVAIITYLSTDIESIELLKNNVTLTEYSARRITGKGNYTLTIMDHANNKNTANFQLRDSVNSATIWSLIILTAIISGVFCVVRLSKRKVVVR